MEITLCCSGNKGMKEDQMENKRNLNCKKGMETKITHFCLQTRGLIRVWEEEEEEEEEEGGSK